MRALALVVLLLVPTTAFAQDADRYRLERTDSGFARIDTATGEVSTCTETGDQLVCRMAADERAALQVRLDELEERVALLEESGTGANRMPSDAEIDRALGLMERFMRGFVGIVREMEEPGRGT